MEAQRYPADYSSIAVGDPVNYFTQMNIGGIIERRARDNHPDGFVPPAKLAFIHDAVLKACDVLDGVKDGTLEDPRRCALDPKTIECKGTDEVGCLTAAQVEWAGSSMARSSIHTRKMRYSLV